MVACHSHKVNGVSSSLTSAIGGSLVHLRTTHGGSTSLVQVQTVRRIFIRLIKYKKLGVLRIIPSRKQRRLNLINRKSVA